MRKITTILLAVLTMSQVITGCSVQNKMRENITITAHRGASYFAPENTIASVKKALELNVDRIEIDIQRTRDSVVVVLHDLTIDRTTNGRGRAVDLTYSQIQQYDIVDSEGNVHKIPTLEQVIQAVNGQAKLLIEIRNGHSFYPDIERQVIDLLRANNAIEWAIIHSFHNDILSRLREYCADIELHKIFVGRIPFTNIIFGYRFSNLNNPLFETVSEFSSHHRFTNRALVRRIHRQEKKLNVWSPKSARRIERLINRGVDGIITDNPMLIIRETE